MDQRWTERLFKRFVPHYRHRWEIYNERLNSCISPDTEWIDVGCGRNDYVARFGGKGKLAIHFDPHHKYLESPYRISSLAAKPSEKSLDTIDVPCSGDDVFPTAHRFNNPKKMKDGLLMLNLSHIEMLEQAAFDRAYLFLIFAPWCLLSQLSLLKHLRSNILAVFEKST